MIRLLICLARDLALNTCSRLVAYYIPIGYRVTWLARDLTLNTCSCLVACYILIGLAELLFSLLRFLI